MSIDYYCTAIDAQYTFLSKRQTGSHPKGTYNLDVKGLFQFKMNKKLFASLPSLYIMKIYFSVLL